MMKLVLLMVVDNTKYYPRGRRSKGYFTVLYFIITLLVLNIVRPWLRRGTLWVARGLPREERLRDELLLVIKNAARRQSA